MIRRAVLLASLTLAACEAPTDEPAEDTAPAAKPEAAEAVIDGKADWSFDICERRGWYGDGECDWFCWDPDPDCDLPPLGDEPAGEATAYPIVLAHGFDGSPTNRWGWYGVAEALEADGHTVFVAQVPPYAPVKTRAGHLARAIDEALETSGADRVNVIAHSMGGLDSRYVVSSLGYGDRVASLTTISTPHRGSNVADVGLKLVPGAASGALNALAEAWGRTFSEVADDPDLLGALTDIAEKTAPAFNAANPDDAKVYYQSWAGVSSVLGLKNDADAAACGGKLLRHPGTQDRMHVTLVPMAAFTAHGAALLPNDGMVTVESAKWGAFRGCIPADHLDEVGQPKHDEADPNTGFDHVRFYRNMAFELAAQGF
ncbi:MAG: triacylglycerol lipase [Myxococcales bacterium]|nr:triacylglycerol lipase [Myxococcales bacterium]